MARPTSRLTRFFAFNSRYKKVYPKPGISMASPTTYAPGIPQKSLFRYPILLPCLGHDGVPGRLGLTASMGGEGKAEVLRYVGRLAVPDIRLACHVLPPTKPPHQAARNTTMVSLGSVDNIYWARTRGSGSCTRANVLSVTKDWKSETKEHKLAVGCRPLFPPDLKMSQLEQNCV